MIKITRFNHSELVINADLIEFVEQTPDTVITMVTGRKVLVRESAEEITRRVVAYRQDIGPFVPQLGNLSEQSEEHISAATA